MVRFSDDRFMAAMTTIIIFLPPAIHYSSPPFWVSTAEKNSCITQRDPQKLWQNCTMKVLPFLIVCFTTVALADDFKLVSGKEYKNVTVSRVEPDGIVLKSKSGISKVYFVELSPDVQKRFQYNAAIASGLFRTASRQSGDDGCYPSQPIDRSHFARHAGGHQST